MNIWVNKITVISVAASRALMPVTHLIRLVLKQSFSAAEHAVKSISKRINNLRNEDIKFAERPPLACKSSWRKEVSTTAAPSLSSAEYSNAGERERGCVLDECLSGSEREAFGSCVRLSESVPALAIKSGRGSGWAGKARVLKCSLRRVGFCLPRAVSERLLAVRNSVTAAVVPVVTRRGSRVLVRVSERDASDSAVTALFRSRSSAGKVPAHN